MMSLFSVYDKQLAACLIAIDPVMYKLCMPTCLKVDTQEARTGHVVKILRRSLP